MKLLAIYKKVNGDNLLDLGGYFGPFLPGIVNFVLSRSYFWTHGKKHQGTQKKKILCLQKPPKGARILFPNIDFNQR